MIINYPFINVLLHYAKKQPISYTQYADYKVKWVKRKKKYLFINSFVYSNFNNCLLIWHFCSYNSMRKIEKVKMRCLQIILNDYESNCDALLHQSGKSTMEVKRLCTLAIEIFKVLNNQNLSFMREVFHRSPYVSHIKQNLFVQSHKTAAFWKTLGPQTWNSLAEKIKLVTNLVDIKNSIKKWFGLNACATFALLKMKMQKIGHENLSLQTKHHL